jgi:hypothetical protein
MKNRTCLTLVVSQAPSRNTYKEEVSESEAGEVERLSNEPSCSSSSVGRLGGEDMKRPGQGWNAKQQQPNLAVGLNKTLFVF